MQAHLSDHGTATLHAWHEDHQGRKVLDEYIPSILAHHGGIKTKLMSHATLPRTDLAVTQAEAAFCQQAHEYPQHQDSVPSAWRITWKSMKKQRLVTNTEVTTTIMAKEKLVIPQQRESW